jgi:hypothetical protein
MSHEYSVIPIPPNICLASRAIAISTLFLLAIEIWAVVAYVQRISNLVISVIISANFFVVIVFLQ